MAIRIKIVSQPPPENKAKAWLVPDAGKYAPVRKRFVCTDDLCVPIGFELRKLHEKRLINGRIIPQL